jgi:hypothetical protein
VTISNPRQTQQMNEIFGRSVGNKQSNIKSCASIMVHELQPVL